MLTTRRLSIALVAVLLLAAFGLPPATAAEDPAQAAVKWLKTQQLPDGSFGGPGKQPSAAITADVVYALALAGENVDGPEWTVGGQSALDALAKMAPGYIGSDAGQAGKIARAVGAAGANPRSFGGMDVIAVIEKAYDAATGRYHPSFLFRQTLAMEGLQISGQPVPAAAYNALCAQPSWRTEAGSGPSPAPRQTSIRPAACSRCWAGSYPAGATWTSSRPRITSREIQTSSGAWAVDAPPTTSAVNSNSTALAVGGLRATGRNPNAAPFIKGGEQRDAGSIKLSGAERSVRVCGRTG